MIIKFNSKKSLLRISLITIVLSTIISFSFKAMGQAGDVSQIRNGPATDPTKNFFSTFPNPDWVNGNAGASNAHYREGYSIGYRSLITGVTAGNCYEYVLEYDTYHGAMAIDYLTHFQRLEPHGPFGHAAEVIDPRIFKSGSKEYIMGINTTNTATIPAPAESGITSGSTKDISHQPTASYNALPANEKLMTIYNGHNLVITYEHQDQIAISGNVNTASSIRVRFVADKDSVVLAWGGHIASRIDWGFNTSTTKALSAAGISGSPYHMRQISMNTCTGTKISLGNQDRSLSAAAVFPPPECPTVTSKAICLGTSSMSFTIDNPVSGVTYTWSINSATNTANAGFSGGAANVIGNTITVVPATNTGFTVGSFSLDITANLNGVTQTCTGVATGSVRKVVVSASANPTSVDITSSAHSTELTATIDNSSYDTDPTHYTYLWTASSGATGSFNTTQNSRIATYTAGTADASSTITFTVVATHVTDNDANTEECSDDATVNVDFNSAGNCTLTGHDPVCSDAAAITHTANTKASTATYNWTLTGYGGSGTTTATFESNNTQTLNGGGSAVNVVPLASYRITVYEVYQNSAFNTSCYQDILVDPAPSISTVYNPPGCSDKTFTVDVVSPTIGYKYSIVQNNNEVFNDITPSAGSPNVHFSGLINGDGYTVTVTTPNAHCTATSNCDNSVVCPVASAARINNVTNTNEPLAKSVPKTYNIVFEPGANATAIPNPYTDKVRFNLQTKVSGYGSLELYNALGQKIGVVYEGYMQAGMQVNKDYLVPSANRSTLIYIFKVGEQRVTGKLIGPK